MGYIHVLMITKMNRNTADKLSKQVMLGFRVKTY